VTNIKSSDQASVAIIGGGPAGLMAAEVLIQKSVPVELYEAMPSMGRKFLVAGKGGLNITHAEPFELFLTRYGSRRPQLEPYLSAFGPTELRAWLQELGFETFVGTSNKVFPKVMKAGPILHAWLERLRAIGVQFHTHHRWQGWDESRALRFSTPEGDKVIPAKATLLALGGGSWPKLGSDGAWVELLKERRIPIEPLKPANCGFDVSWSEHFWERFAGQPLKAVKLTFKDSRGGVFQQRGEFVITEDGVEGSLVYTASARIRDEIESQGQAIVHLDLSPDRSHQELMERISRPRGARSISEHIRRTVSIQGVKAGLLWEFLPKETFTNPVTLAEAIKALPIPLKSPRPLDEAISSAGGVAFEALDQNLMIRSLPGVFCAGEMLDWEAPTGGYLLTACFSTGRAAGFGVLEWLTAETPSIGGVSA
jgi:uncharacterized flavoprotein (TIGR03862 family)